MKEEKENMLSSLKDNSSGLATIVPLYVWLLDISSCLDLLVSQDYFLEIEDTFSNLYQFKKLHVSPKEKNLNFFLDLKTKYEQKAINKGFSPSYLVYKKV